MMTVSLPVTLPAPAVAGKAGSSAPAKGVSSAPGQAAKMPGDGAEAAEVAGMFAALVAALTEQMQPPVVPDEAAAGGQTAEGETPEPAAAPFVVPVVAVSNAEGTTQPVAAAAAIADDLVVTNTKNAELTTATAAAAASDADADIVVPAAALTEDADGATDADALAPRAERAVATKGGGQAQPAVPSLGARGAQDRPTPPSGTVPATPATPATPADGTGPATPATPADGTGPAAPAAPAAPATPATPAAKVVDPETAPVVSLPTAPVTAAPATPAEAVAAPAAPPPADPHLQIARVVRPLRLGDDGAYELALDLTPAELGRVRIDVELRGTTINLSLRADNPGTRELLQASLDQLRAELEGAGLQAGSMDIGGQKSDGYGPAADETSTPVTGLVEDDATTVADAAADSTTDPDPDAGVDVLA